MIEKAVYITKQEQLARITERYSRLYFGNEFCQRLLPSRSELANILELAGKNSMDLTLVTPYVTDDGIAAVTKLLEVMASLDNCPSEVVFNDWGVFRVLTGERFRGKIQPVLGRLLSKQKRDPRIGALKGVPEDSMEYFRSFSADSSAFGEFLYGRGVKRIELDNVFQGIKKNSKMKASLYYPYGYITTTRMCFFSGSEGGPRYLRRIAPCEMECKEYDVKLKSDMIGKEIFQKGNAQFFSNDALPLDMEQLSIDRTVYEPFLPI